MEKKDDKSDININNNNKEEENNNTNNEKLNIPNEEIEDTYNNLIAKLKLKNIDYKLYEVTLK